MKHLVGASGRRPLASTYTHSLMVSDPASSMFLSYPLYLVCISNCHIHRWPKKMMEALSFKESEDEAYAALCPPMFSPLPSTLLLSVPPPLSFAECGAARLFHCGAQRSPGGPAAARRFQKARLPGPRVRLFVSLSCPYTNAHTHLCTHQSHQFPQAF